MFLLLKVGQQADSEVHRPADVDVDFLVGFVEVKVVDIKGSLDAGVVD